MSYGSDNDQCPCENPRKRLVINGLHFLIQQIYIFRTFHTTLNSFFSSNTINIFDIGVFVSRSTAEMLLLDDLTYLIFNLLLHTNRPIRRADFIYLRFFLSLHSNIGPFSHSNQNYLLELELNLE